MNTALVDVDLKLPVEQERIDRVFTKQCEHSLDFKKTGSTERVAILRAVFDWVDKHQQDIRDALYKDFTKPGPEVDLSEVWMVLTEIRHIMRNLKRWMKPKRVVPTLATFSTRSFVQYEARGTSLVISPWNYPVTLTIVPMVSALAAGNTVVLKPSEFSPHTSALLGKMVKDLFPEELVSLFEGDKHTAQALLNKPFDHIYFTGSPNTGKAVMKAAAQHLSSVTLELGGKSPVIIHESANLDYAVKQIVWGKFLNCGQTCISPDYILVHNAVFEKFINKLQNELTNVFGKNIDDWESFSDYARIITPYHFKRLTEMLKNSIDSGGKVLMGGRINSQTRYISPTIVLDAPETSQLMTEEIFGPILPISKYDDLDTALQFIRSRPKPLALYAFSRDKKVVQKILRETSAGGTCINDVVLHFLQLNLPFGGIKESGSGQIHGFSGFKTFSHERAVLKHQSFNVVRFLGPPYNNTIKKLIRFIARYL